MQVSLPKRWRVFRERWVERKGKFVSLVCIHSSLVHRMTSNKHYDKYRPEKCEKLEEMLWENTVYELWGNLPFWAKFNGKEIKLFKDMAYSKGHFSRFWALKLSSDVKFYTGCLDNACLIMTMYRKRFLSCPASVTYPLIQRWQLTSTE